MPGELTGGKAARHALALLAFLALALRILFPPGFMPGSDVARPVVVCPGQMPAGMAMDGGGRDHSDKAPHGVEHPCPFAVGAATPLAPDVAPAEPVVSARRYLSSVAPARAVAPGRGMAAPPPPSHAPPVIRV